MTGRQVAVLLALVAMLGAVLAWIATREPERTEQVVRTATIVTVPERGTAGAQSTKRPRSASGNRRQRRGAGEVAGRVREYGTDRPLAGLALSLAAGTPGPGRTIEATTAADGSFVVEDADEFDHWTLTIRAAAPLADAELTDVRVTTGARTDVGIVYLAPSFAVPGIVVDERGRPIEGAEVLAARPAPGGTRLDIVRVLSEIALRPRPVDRATTGADGRFRMTRLVPATYDFAAAKAGFATTIEGAVLVTPAAEKDELRIVVRKGLEATGRVLRRGGVPAEGVTVVAFTEPRGKMGSVDPLGKVFATTGADGGFRLDRLAPGRYLVVASPSGAPAVVKDSVRIPAAAPIEIVLEGDADLEGTVTGPDDRPVAGAQVLVISEKTKSFASVVTEPDGRYAVTGLPSGVPAGLIVTADGLAPFPADMSSALSKSRDEPQLVPGTNWRDVKLLAGATVKGTVRERDGGAPVAGVRVQVTSRSNMLGGERGATTDAEGKFAIAGVAAGTSLLNAVKEGWHQPDLTPEMITAAFGGGGPSSGRATDVASDAGPVVVIAAGTTLVERDLTIARTGTIRGRVESPDGAPAAGAQVSLALEQTEGLGPVGSMLPGDVPTEPRLSDQSGAFEIPAPPPGRSARIVARRTGLAPGRTDPVRGGEDVSDVVVRLRNGAVFEGRVTDAAGKPVEDAVVRWAGGGVREFESAGTDADGRWSAPLVEPGTYFLAVTHGRYLPWTRKDVTAEEGKTATIDATLELGAVISGFVRAPDGKPFAGATVEVTTRGKRTGPQPAVPGGDFRAPVVSAADGSFVAEGLVAGPCTVQARAEGFVASERVEVNAPADGVVLSLAQAFSIRGVVRARGGGPVGGIDVRAQAPVAPAAGAKGPAGTQMMTASSSRTAPDGSFEVAGLAAGLYELRVDPDTVRGVRPNLLPATLAGVAAGAEGVTVEMEAGLVLAGTVVLPDGSAAAGGRISCEIERLKGTPRAAGGRGWANVAGGRFEIVGLAPGTYDLSVDVPGHASQHLKAAAGTTDVRIRLAVGGTATGRVLLPDGAPAVSASVTVSGELSSGGARTDSDGRFRVEHLPEGTYSIRVSHSASGVMHRGTASGVELREGTVTDVPDITCEKQAAGRAPIPPAPLPPK